MNLSSCINCSRCILVCPTGALTEHSYLNEVITALNDPEKTVVVQHAPAVSVTLAEEFNVKPGRDVDGKITHIMPIELSQKGSYMHAVKAAPFRL